MEKEKKNNVGIIIAVIAIVAIIGIAVGVTVFQMNKNNNSNNQALTSSESLETVMEKLYANIPEDSMPMMLRNTELTSENIENYIGTADISFKEAIASESMTGSIAHSVVLLRLNNASDSNEVVEKIKNSANPRKWICVEASNVAVKSKGDLVVLIMSDEEKAPILETNFNNL